MSEWYSENWKRLNVAPRYSISTYGNIVDTVTGLYIKPEMIPGSPHQYVRLIIEHMSNRFRLDLLAMDAFMAEKHDRYTLIHKDGDQCNNHIDNLRWMVRYKTVRDFYSNQKVRVVETDEIFDSIDECADVLGLKRCIIRVCLNSKLLMTGCKHFEAVDGE